MKPSAWAAGIIDGEGYVGCTIRHGRWPGIAAARVAVGNNDIRMLDFLTHHWSGTIYRKRLHPLAGVWEVKSRLAEAFLHDILPHLVCKGSQAFLALCLASWMIREGGAQRNNLQLRSAKHTVWCLLRRLNQAHRKPAAQVESQET